MGTEHRRPAATGPGRGRSPARAASRPGGSRPVDERALHPERDVPGHVLPPTQPDARVSYSPSLSSMTTLCPVKLQGRRVLVTGGAGFIGSHVVELLACANQVTVLDDLSVGRVENLASVASRVRVVRGDITDRDLVAEVAREVEIIVHMAVVCLRKSIGDPLR